MHSSEPTVHARFRRREVRSNWVGLLVAVAVHFALFAFAPGMTVAGLGGEVQADVKLEPPDVLPEPPRDEEIVRPGEPIIGDVEVDATIPKNVDFSSVPILPDPPTATTGAERAFEFTPRDVEPSLRNTRDVQRHLERSYPPAVRDAGMGGIVTLWLYIDAAGNVLETRVQESSGIAALDEAARAVASEMQFRPAQYRGRSVPVWVAQRIEFTTR